MRHYLQHARQPSCDIGVVLKEGIENKDVKKRYRRKAKFIQPTAPKVDPELLRELGRIGNNINQIARSLNHLCLGKQADKDRFSFGMCLKVLSEIQQELHQHLHPLPPIFRSDEAVERAKQRAIARATTGRD
ncbi:MULTISPECIES: MobC family plasmid mobilization relaxosome protein [unclassified Acinetobacter]|uniref:MobC family plasmid mobilization relaxosome protein n=1 Tax=unclassified Acinetobacter TaxID=196816 RepID=UPI00207638E6|nr:MobC family plasmid mobilization relaxosome protein [Acinetobacter sp. ANC 4218]